MNTIRLLTFDLDNTLWNVETVVMRAERDMMQWLQQHYPAFAQKFDTAALYQLRRDIAREQRDIAHDLTRLRIATLEAALLQSGHGAHDSRQGAEAAFEVFFQGRNAVTFFPAVRETLAELKALYMLHALSNGNADIQRVGLGDVFSLHLSAASVGAPKPDPAMYRRALEAAGVTPRQAVHIGDHPEQDVDAARRVGMKTVWVNYDGADWQGDERPDAEIRHFSELPEVIRQLHS